MRCHNKLIFLFNIFCAYFRAVVHIQVKDVNEFSPAFKESVYKASVTEGKIYDSILQVEATDEDCSPQYSQICNYEIVTTDVPFAIDRNGECCPSRALCRALSAWEHQLIQLERELQRETLFSSLTTGKSSSHSAIPSLFSITAAESNAVMSCGN